MVTLRHWPAGQGLLGCFPGMDAQGAIFALSLCLAPELSIREEVHTYLVHWLLNLMPWIVLADSKEMPLGHWALETGIWVLVS